MNAISKNTGSSQMSDALSTGVFLILSGGFQDAYTYCCRGEVFANAQTGNIVLMSKNLFSGDWKEALVYLMPLLAFGLGIYFTEYIRSHYKNLQKVHWRQLILLGEIFLLFFVGFMDNSWDIPANILISFACAMQVQTFRKLDGYAYASTMCIGNLRSGTEAFYGYRQTGNPAVRKKSFEYFAVILIFAAGAGLGALATRYFQLHAIWFSCFLLLVSLCLMFLQKEPN